MHRKYIYSVYIYEYRTCIADKWIIIQTQIVFLFLFWSGEYLMFRKHILWRTRRKNTPLRKIHLEYISLNNNNNNNNILVWIEITSVVPVWPGLYSIIIYSVRMMFYSTSFTLPGTYIVQTAHTSIQDDQYTPKKNNNNFQKMNKYLLRKNIKFQCSRIN